MYQKRYQVNVCKAGHWRPVGGRVRPLLASTIEGAIEMRDAAREVPGVVETMIIELETATYSDLVTRQEFNLTTYKGIL